MSNPARRRGRGGNTQPPSETSSARGGGLAPYDGPASRGGGSNVSSSGRPPSMPPSATSAAGSPPASPSTSPRAAQPGTFAPASSSPSSAGRPVPLLTDPARDPARQARLTDTVRNVDLPASLYNLDNLVCCSLEYLADSSYIVAVLPLPVNVFTLRILWFIVCLQCFSPRRNRSSPPCDSFTSSLHRIILQAYLH